MDGQANAHNPSRDVLALLEPTVLPANRYASRKKVPAGPKHCMADCVHMLARRRPQQGQTSCDGLCAYAGRKKVPAGPKHCMVDCVQIVC